MKLFNYLQKFQMKCLINYVLNFSKILHIHLNKLTSSTFIKKAVSSLEEKQIILCSRSSPKNPYKYYLNTNFIASKHNLNKSKLYSNIIHISPSKFQFYISHILIPINSIDNYILKKQFNLLHKNFSFILQEHLNTNVQNFFSDFQNNLQSYKNKIQEINKYIKQNSLKKIPNYQVTTILNTPASIKKEKTSYYRRLEVSFRFLLNFIYLFIFIFFTGVMNKQYMKNYI